jgi:GT2 family glycosyltransferase
MEKTQIVFCVLTYKNHTDLAEFIESLKVNENINFSYKIVVVNSFADESSLKKIRQIALSNNCIFINTENKGYGHGNNLGISFAKENYIFEYLVVCNPDTVIKHFDINSLKGQENNINAPEIICLNGKRQNPLNYTFMPMVEKLAYIAMKKRNKLLLYTVILLNKINRHKNKLLMDLRRKKSAAVYACHGSYIIFSRKAIETLYPVFDENIFLFCEESDLAKNAEKHSVDIIFNKNIVILHKEDGSMKMSNFNLNEIHRQSYLYYYEKWNTV